MRTKQQKLDSLMDRICLRVYTLEDQIEENTYKPGYMDVWEEQTIRMAGRLRVYRDRLWIIRCLRKGEGVFSKDSKADEVSAVKRAFLAGFPIVGR